MKKRVLFLCIGNSCRSPMAEGFARAYGSDVLEAKSAGLSPVSIIQPLTRKVMLEKNIDLGEAPRTAMEDVDLESIDLIVNLSGQALGVQTIPSEDWAVQDPIGRPEWVYRAVAADIEARVMRLILRLRRGA